MNHSKLSDFPRTHGLPEWEVTYTVYDEDEMDSETVIAESAQQAMNIVTADSQGIFVVCVELVKY